MKGVVVTLYETDKTVTPADPEQTMRALVTVLVAAGWKVADPRPRYATAMSPTRSQFSLRVEGDE